MKRLLIVYILLSLSYVFGHENENIAKESLSSKIVKQFPKEEEQDTSFRVDLFLSRAKNNRGLQAAGLCSYTTETSKGLQAAGIFTQSAGEVMGVQAAGIVSNSDGDLRGAQYAGIFNNLGGTLYGVQYGGIFNIVHQDVLGVQYAGIFNHLNGKLRGMQVAGIYNKTENKVMGAQISGIVNSAQDVRGLQLSLINKARDIKGSQIGLININRRHKGLNIGLINYSSTGLFHPTYWNDERGYSYFGLQQGNRSFYSIAYMGIKDVDFNQRTDSLSAGFGFGTHMDLGPLFAEADISIKTLEYSQWYSEEDQYLDNTEVYPYVRFSGGIYLGKRWALFGGISYDGQVLGYTKEEPFLEYQQKGAPGRIGDMELLWYPTYFIGLKI